MVKRLLSEEERQKLELDALVREELMETALASLKRKGRVEAAPDGKIRILQRPV